MILQDIIITITTIVLSVSLIPQVFFGFKNKIGTISYVTSISSFIALLVMGTAFATLGLWLSAIITYTNAIPWMLFAIQRFLYHK